MQQLLAYCTILNKVGNVKRSFMFFALLSSQQIKRWQVVKLSKGGSCMEPIPQQTVDQSDNGSKYSRKHDKDPSKLLKFLNSKKVVPYIFVSPFIISFLILTFYPAVQG